MHLGTDLRSADSADASTRTSGLAADTIVLTLDGEMPVEHLSPGDRVITRDSGMAVLRDVRVDTVLVAPIRIRAGSLGHTRPDTDTLVAPSARLHIRDWRAEALYGQPQATIAAHRLVDGEFVAEMPARQMTLYTLLFENAHIVYANGLEIAIG